MQRAAGAFRLKALIAMVAMLLATVPAMAQTRNVSGTVLDESGEPLIGASVVAQGSTTGVATDIDGNFTIQVGAQCKQITVSYIGYLPQTVAITGEKLTITLQPNSQTMEELVVIGYGVQKKNDLTGSISTISEKDFNGGVISSPEELINGKVAGVQIINSGGSPNASSTIRVRGGASLNASNDPLIVLDGVPMEVGGSVSGQSNFLSLINPNDIESMTILKDASSTAIYGSRASNGVIIITTKKGSGDGVHVSFQSTNSISTRTRMADMLDRQGFIDAIRTFGTAEQAALIGTENTDWNDEIFHTAFGTDNSVAVSGRAAKWLPFRVALGAMYQEGILRTDNSKRYTANLNLNPSFLDDHLRVGVSAKGTYSNNRFAETGAIWTASVYNPTWPVYDTTTDQFGGYYNTVDNTGGPANGAQPNPLGQLELYKSTSDVYRVLGNVDVDYRLHWVPELRIHAVGGYDFSKGSGHVVIPVTNYNYQKSDGRDYVYGPQKNYNKIFTIYANYNKEFEAIRSTLDVTAGYDYQYWRYTNAAYEELDLNGVSRASSAAGDQRHTLLSYYGRVNYTFDNRYLLTATFRRDGSSRFSRQNRWGTFPSVALAWRLSEEGFFEGARGVVNDLKPRVSYGVTGQQDGIANYGYLPVYTVGQAGAQYQFGGVPVYTYRPEAYNPNLKWETTKSWNAGFDFGVLNNRISGSVDYYNRRTEDLLATVPMAAGINFDKQMLTNVGNVKSQGVEIALNANLVATKDWSWTATFNATWQRTRITNLTLIPGAESPDTGVGPYLDGTPVQVFSTGYAPYAYYVYKQVYDEATGRPLEGVYADLNGDGRLSDADLYHYHSPAPDWILGFSTQLRYKNWTLGTSLRANIGNYVYNGMSANMGAWECTSWCAGQVNNLSSSFAETQFTKRQYLSDYYVENGSFLKMDNLQLSYDFGRVANAVNIHLSAMVQNVFTVTKYKGVDPESQTGVDTSVYPRPRTYSLTLGLNF
ncbi:MAG: TonB-dependent receptor [Muribaculaceae bacterium]|nr:TonB-dependent receptor [Muribaculaceae bacterium]